MTQTMTPAQEIQAEARQVFREALKVGEVYTGAALAEQFGRKPRWGQERIAEVRAEEEAQELLPGEVEIEGLEGLEETQGSAESHSPVVEAQEGAEEPRAVIPQQTNNGNSSHESARAEEEAQKKPRKFLKMFSRREVRQEAKRAKEEAKPRKAQKAQKAVPHAQRRGASAIAWLAFGLGIILSVLANIGHIWFVSQPEDEAMISAMIFAAFWPIGLAISVEVLSRVAWPSGLKMPGIIGTVFVGGVALIVSYQHMQGLLLHFGESELSAALGPLGVDGLLIVGGVAILAIGETKRVDHS